MSQKIKAQVIAAFNDREHKSDTYQIGDTFEGSKNRVDELMAGGYLAPIEETDKKER